jgi:hypothetical protein
MTPDERRLFRHLLATIAFRLRGGLQGAPAEFGDFTPGHGVRTPCELVHHMTRVLERASASFGDVIPKDLDTLSWQEEVNRFFQALRQLDDDVAHRDPKPDALPLLVLIQGPISDVLTHCGQITLLRRLAGYPVEGRNFMKADIRIGSLDNEQ